MAIRSKKRTMSARIVLTAEAYKAVEESSFKNCRTVSQELSYMIERQIAGKLPQESIKYAPLDRYDAPVALYDATTAHPDAQGATETTESTLPPAEWTHEQEDGIYAIGKDAGLAESQVTALRLIHKNYGAVLAAIEDEKVPA